MPLIELDPPQPRPRGQNILRLSQLACGSVQKPQFCGFFVGMSLPAPAGIRTSRLESFGPASSSATFAAPSSLRRAASTQPALPAPTIT
jgi:hypothetical protein